MNKPDSKLIGKISGAIRDMGTWAADKRNREQGYDYISADQVLARAGAALAAQGVVVVPEVTASTVEATERQGKSPRLDAKVTMCFTVRDDDDNVLVSQWTGHGSDYSSPDKAVYKAITSGHKYYLLKLLCIGIGNDDSEHDSETASRPPNGKPTAAHKPATPREDMSDLAERWAKLANRAVSLGVPVPTIDPISREEWTQAGRALLAAVQAAEAQQGLSAKKA